MQNKFFNSKLNTALLLVLIILMIIALRWMYDNKQVYVNGIKSEVPTGYTTTINNPNDKDYIPATHTKENIVIGKNNFSGKITALDNGCWSDGICKIQVDSKTWVTYNIGRNINHYPIGNVEGELVVGAKVEVYGEKDSAGNDYTLVGNENYYIKVVRP